MQRKIKISIDQSVSHKSLSYLELCSVLKQITYATQFKLSTLSNVSGVNYPNLTTILNQKKENPTISSLEKIANALGYDIEFSLDLIEERKKSLM